MRVKQRTIGNSIRISGKGAIIVIFYIIVKELFIEYWLLSLRIVLSSNVYSPESVCSTRTRRILKLKPETPPHRLRKRLKLNSNQLIMNPIHERRNLRSERSLNKRRH